MKTPQNVAAFRAATRNIKHYSHTLITCEKCRKRRSTGQFVNNETICTQCKRRGA